MKTFCFTVDDNIRFLQQITENGYNSIFEHPYLAMYKRLHERFGLKVQLNLFYRQEEFTLSDMSDKYYAEWEKNSDWLKLSFHSDFENENPYQFSGYDEVFCDCNKVNNEIIRFASPKALAKTTTIHYCLTTKEGNKALSDNGVRGLLGIFGNCENPRTSYLVDSKNAKKIRDGEIIKLGELSFSSLNLVINSFSAEVVSEKLEALKERSHLNVMIHEQYFYPDYKRYQPNFENKLRVAFEFLKKNGYESVFFEELI